MNAMIEYMNGNHGDKYHFRYSTPSDYIDALQKLDVRQPTKYDDMFPYSDNPQAYWTGYFTSRANLKHYIRRLSWNFHTSTSLFSQKVLDAKITGSEVDKYHAAVETMLDSIGIAQHHDAVKGTSKGAVAGDYARRFYEAKEKNNKVYGEIIVV